MVNAAMFKEDDKEKCVGEKFAKNLEEDLGRPKNNKPVNPGPPSEEFTS